jgi:hypothetical protein
VSSRFFFFLSIRGFAFEPSRLCRQPRGEAFDGCQDLEHVHTLQFYFWEIGSKGRNAASYFEIGSLRGVPAIPHPVSTL